MRAMRRWVFLRPLISWRASGEFLLTRRVDPLAAVAMFLAQKVAHLDDFIGALQLHQVSAELRASGLGFGPGGEAGLEEEVAAVPEGGEEARTGDRRQELHCSGTRRYVSESFFRAAYTHLHGTSF